QGTAELARLCRTRTRHRVVRHPDARPAHRRSLAASHQHRGSRHVEKAENRHLIPCAATEGTLDCSRLWSEAWVRGFPGHIIDHVVVGTTSDMRNFSRQHGQTRNLLNDRTAVEGCQDVNETDIWYLSVARGAFGSA